MSEPMFSLLEINTHFYSQNRKGVLAFLREQSELQQQHQNLFLLPQSETCSTWMGRRTVTVHQTGTSPVEPQSTCRS